MASTAPPSSQSKCWISDTGATDYFALDLANLLDSSIYNDSQLVSVGNGQQLPISHTGNAQLYTSSYLFKLKNILCVPSMSSNLLFVNGFCGDNHCSFHFDSDKFHFRDRLSRKPLYKGLSRDGLGIDATSSFERTFFTASICCFGYGENLQGGNGGLGRWKGDRRCGFWVWRERERERKGA